jgi:hypothetical protein
MLSVIEISNVLGFDGFIWIRVIPLTGNMDFFAYGRARLTL